jgi:hypothetical protein
LQADGTQIADARGTVGGRPVMTIPDGPNNTTSSAAQTPCSFPVARVKPARRLVKVMTDFVAALTPELHFIVCEHADFRRLFAGVGSLALPSDDGLSLRRQRPGLSLSDGETGDRPGAARSDAGGVSVR